MVKIKKNSASSYEANPFAILIRKPWYRVAFSTFFKTFFGYIRADQTRQGLLDYLFLGIPAFLKWAYHAVDLRSSWKEWQKGILKGLIVSVYFTLFGLPLFLLASALVLLIAIPLIVVNVAAIFREAKLPDELADVPSLPPYSSMTTTTFESLFLVPEKRVENIIPDEASVAWLSKPTGSPSS